MNFKSVDEILEFAINNEKEAVEFYSSLAKKATQPSFKTIFEDFAKEEENHVNLLADISGNKEKIDSYEFKTITDLKISDYLVETDYEEGMAMPEILKIAMKKEETAVKLYSAMSAQTDHQDAKKVFQILVQEEAKHKLALETLYDDDLFDQGN